jgi:hypothetical protein
LLICEKVSSTHSILFGLESTNDNDNKKIQEEEVSHNHIKHEEESPSSRSVQMFIAHDIKFSLTTNGLYDDI